MTNSWLSSRTKSPAACNGSTAQPVMRNEKQMSEIWQRGTLCLHGKREQGSAALLKRRRGLARKSDVS